MTTVRYIPDRGSTREIMQSDTVRAALKARADLIAPAAQAIAADEVDDGFAQEIHVEEGTRPRGRPYARVVANRSDAEAHEWGDTNTIRRRILGRAAGIGDVFPGEDGDS